MADGILNWEQRSSRLWVAEHEGRIFRVERHHAANTTAGATAREVDSGFRDLQRERVKGVIAGKKLAEKWAISEQPTEPVRREPSTGIRDLTLGLGTRR